MAFALKRCGQVPQVNIIHALGFQHLRGLASIGEPSQVRCGPPQNKIPGPAPPPGSAEPNASSSPPAQLLGPFHRERLRWPPRDGAAGMIVQTAGLQRQRRQASTASRTRYLAQPASTTQESHTPSAAPSGQEAGRRSHCPIKTSTSPAPFEAQRWPFCLDNGSGQASPRRIYAHTVRWFYPSASNELVAGGGVGCASGDPGPPTMAAFEAGVRDECLPARMPRFGLSGPAAQQLAGRLPCRTDRSLPSGPRRPSNRRMGWRWLRRSARQRCTMGGRPPAPAHAPGMR